MKEALCDAVCDVVCEVLSEGQLLSLSSIIVGYRARALLITVTKHPGLLHLHPFLVP